MSISMILRASFLAAIFGASFSASAQAYSINDFDLGYNPGALAGQNGWLAGSGGLSNAPQVTNSRFLSGDKSVLLGYPGSGSSTVSVAAPFAPVGITQENRQIRATADIYIENFEGDDRYFGIGLGSSSLASDGFLGIALGGNGLRGGVGSFSSYDDFEGGLLSRRDREDYVGRWVTVMITADRWTKQNNVWFTFIGLGRTSGAYIVEYTQSFDFSATPVTSAQIFCGGGAGQGTAFIDNANFRAQGAPEPTSMAALAVGAVALLRRGKRA